MAEQDKPKSPAELAAENKQLREQLDALNRAKAVDNTPGWFRCSHSELPGHMSCIVQAKGKQDAILQFCKRMGIQYTVQRNDQYMQVGPDKVTDKDIASGAQPMIGAARINVEALGAKRPDINHHVRTHPGTGVKQILYSRAELEAAGYTKDEIELIA